MKIKNKALIGVVVAAGLVAGPASLASATPLEVLGTGPQAGGIEIRDMQHGATSIASGAAARVADGAYWEWGVGVKDTWSNYFREKSCHGSTAVGKKTKRVTGVKGGQYSRALTPKAFSGNKAYYHNC